MGQSRGYGVALSLLWGRAVAMGQSRGYGVELTLQCRSAAARGQCCPHPCNDAVLPLGGSAVPSLQ